MQSPQVKFWDVFQNLEIFGRLQRNANEFRRAKRAGKVSGLFSSKFGDFPGNHKGNANESRRAKGAGAKFGAFS